MGKQNIIDCTSVPGFRLQTLEHVGTNFFFPFTESTNHISMKFQMQNLVTPKQKPLLKETT